MLSCSRNAEISFVEKSRSLKYQKFTSSGFKDIGTRKLEFVSKTLFLYDTKIELLPKNHFLAVHHPSNYNKGVGLKQMTWLKIFFKNYFNMKLIFAVNFCSVPCFYLEKCQLRTNSLLSCWTRRHTG